MVDLSGETGATGGPLHGLRVIELAGIGPAPFAAMMLGDLGADVIRIDRPGGHLGNPVPPELDSMNRNRRSIELDLKSDHDLGLAKELVVTADVFIEGYRPGVAERLGLGPQDCHALNRQLVYARMTGWGQTGSLANSAGHDINYIARVGALDPIGSDTGGPVIPLNLIGDFGGGGMYLAFGILAAVRHAEATGEGQVVDAAIVDGTALLTTMLHAWRSAQLWVDNRSANMLDGGAHFYNVYRTADDRYLSVGAIEPKFYRAFLHGIGVDAEGVWLESHTDSSMWGEMRRRVAEIFGTKTRAEWVRVFEGSDACVAPVLTIAEALVDADNLARETFIEVDGVPQPAPGPRFDRTPVSHPRRQPAPGADTEDIRTQLANQFGWPHRPALAQ
jgi:alpha-methylacyl-CoA racemase